MEYIIYIIEDDISISRLLKEHIDKYGLSARIVENFDNIIEEFLLIKPHLVLLDVNLPKFDGFYWCRRIRENSKVPILFISARESGLDQVRALENGADDYITKPFSYEVVMAKINSHIRRAIGDYATTIGERIIEMDGLKFYAERLEVTFQGKTILLTKKEAILLESLIQTYPKVVNRDYLLEQMWDHSDFVEENTLNVNVTRLRKKLQDLGIANGIQTIRGLGYKLNKSW
ncbi:response regulator transcription factor [Bacillus sp. AFS041924]|uniref:response regulator transcription factor n=1 Tax=Bacillus sp. AFS041924 TaxID=2033503 RepID=UPI000BFE314D|nr:response regulator transcription factor [Bacillus sp. AFS041924]PGS46068.1 DNA-binding response regulator [Bacillus sp. AFS041924]